MSKMLIELKGRYSLGHRAVNNYFHSHLGFRDFLYAQVQGEDTSSRPQNDVGN